MMSEDKKQQDLDHETDLSPRKETVGDDVKAMPTNQNEKKPRSIRDIAIDMAKPFNVRNPFAHTREEIQKGESASPIADAKKVASPEEPVPSQAPVSAAPGVIEDCSDTSSQEKSDVETRIEEQAAEDIQETLEDPQVSERLEREERARIAALELEEALTAAGVDPAVSTCEELRQLAKELETGKAPMFRKEEVCIKRKPALQLIRGLTALCDAQQGDGFEDELFDVLASSDHEDEADFKPMYRVKNRASSIIDDAMRQADVIVNDARLLSNRLLYDTESKIQAKYDEADSEIEARMTTTKEESSKRLSEARDELTASRKQSVEILNLYMNKAEDDYQGYWERAEQTLFASMLKSESVLGKACEIYERELKVIREDLETIEAIMEQLARSRPKV